MYHRFKMLTAFLPPWGHHGVTQRLALLWSDFSQNPWVFPVLCRARRASRCGCGAFRNPRISSVSAEAAERWHRCAPFSEDTPTSCAFAFSLGNPGGTVNSAFVCVCPRLLHRHRVGIFAARENYWLCPSLTSSISNAHNCHYPCNCSWGIWLSELFNSRFTLDAGVWFRRKC